MGIRVSQRLDSRRKNPFGGYYRPLELLRRPTCLRGSPSVSSTLFLSKIYLTGHASHPTSILTRSGAARGIARGMLTEAAKLQYHGSKELCQQIVSHVPSDLGKQWDLVPRIIRSDW